MKNIKKSLKIEVIRNIIIFSIIPILIISGTAYFYISKNACKSIIADSENNLKTSESLINSILKEYINKSVYIASNTYLLNNIFKNHSGVKERYDFYNNLNIYFQSMKDIDVTTHSQFVIYSNNKSIYETEYTEDLSQIENDEIVREIIRDNDNEIHWQNNLAEEDGKKVIVLYKKLYIDNSNISILKVKIPFSRIQELLEQLGGENYTLSYDGVWFNREQGFSADGKEHYYIMQEKLLNGSSLYAAVSNKVLAHRKWVILMSVSLVFALICLIVLLLSIYVTERTTGELLRFINSIKRENLDLKQEDIWENEFEEIDIMCKKIRMLLVENNHLYEENINEKLEKHRFELDLLQMKINPHLLYNTLSVIKWRILKMRDKETAIMIDTLVKYFRSVLGKGKDIITISDEIELIREYIKVMSLVHLKNYEIELDIPDEIMSAHILKMLFQPIVENAILHGLNKKENAVIRIVVKRQDKDILVSISDNGCGMKEDITNNIESGDYFSGYKSYGLKNTIERIKLYYGERYGITIDSKAGEGTCVHILITDLRLDDNCEMTIN